MKYTFAIFFFTMDDALVGKLTISASLKKIYFPKISDQAPLTTSSPTSQTSTMITLALPLLSHCHYEWMHFDFVLFTFLPILLTPTGSRLISIKPLSDFYFTVQWRYFTHIIIFGYFRVNLFFLFCRQVQPRNQCNGKNQSKQLCLACGSFHIILTSHVAR